VAAAGLKLHKRVKSCLSSFSPSVSHRSLGKKAIFGAPGRATV